MNANELLAYNSGYTNGLAQVFKFSEENDKLKTEIEALKAHIEKLQHLNRDGWYYATELKNELEKVQK